MSISSIGSATAATSPFSVQRNQATVDADGDNDGDRVRGSRKSDAFHSDFASLLNAVQSGDINGAQSALQTLQSDISSSSAGYNTTSTTQSPVASDLNSLFAAVKSGDLSAAQSALDSFKSDISAKLSSAAPPVNDQQQGQAKVSGHHHHHHGGGAGGGIESVVSSLLGNTQDPTSATDPASDTPVAT